MSLRTLAALLLPLSLLTACGDKDAEDSGHDEEEHDHDHEHEDED